MKLIVSIYIYITLLFLPVPVIAFDNILDNQNYSLTYNAPCYINGTFYDTISGNESDICTYLSLSDNSPTEGTENVSIEYILPGVNLSYFAIYASFYDGVTYDDMSVNMTVYINGDQYAYTYNDFDWTSQEVYGEDQNTLVWNSFQNSTGNISFLNESFIYAKFDEIQNVDSIRFVFESKPGMSYDLYSIETYNNFHTSTHAILDFENICNNYGLTSGYGDEFAYLYGYPIAWYANGCGGIVGWPNSLMGYNLDTRVVYVYFPYIPVKNVSLNWYNIYSGHTCVFPDLCNSPTFTFRKNGSIVNVSDLPPNTYYGIYNYSGSIDTIEYSTLEYETDTKNIVILTYDEDVPEVSTPTPTPTPTPEPVDHSKIVSNSDVEVYFWDMLFLAMCLYVATFIVTIGDKR